LKEEALDRTMWTARFGRGFGPVARQTAKWMNTHLIWISGEKNLGKVFPVKPEVCVRGGIDLMLVWPCIVNTTVSVTNRMQQFPFIDLFKSALRVSADVFAHLREQFNCMYIFGTMHRPAADRWQGWDGTAAPSQPCHRSVASRCIVPKLYIQLNFWNRASYI
jgi:hypothetical protein